MKSARGKEDLPTVSWSSTSCQQLPFPGSSFSSTPLPAQDLLILKETFPPFPFHLQIYWQRVLLAWGGGKDRFLSHVHRGLAWHKATPVTGEVALLAGAQNCFLWIFLPPNTDLRLLRSLLNATHHSLLWDRMPCVNIRDCKMGEKIAYQQIWLKLPNQPMQRLFVDWRGLVYVEAQNIPEPLFTSLVLCSPARYPALLIRLEHHSWIRQTDWPHSIYKTNTVTSVIPDVQT